MAKILHTQRFLYPTLSSKRILEVIVVVDVGVKKIGRTGRLAWQSEQQTAQPMM